MKGSHQQASLLSALSKQNLIPSESIDDITDDFIGKNIPFIRFLIENKSIDGNSIAKVLSKSFGHPQIQLSKFDTSLVPDGVRNEKLITKHNALPLYLRGKVLFQCKLVSSSRHIILIQCYNQY